MSYQDYMRSSVMSQKPTCWGNERSFDPSDAECSGCRFKHSCAAAIERDARTDRGMSVRVTRGGYTSQRDDGVVGRFEAGQVGAEERPVERFFKDAASGALRGMFYEMYCFWKNYRFK